MTQDPLNFHHVTEFDNDSLNVFAEKALYEVQLSSEVLLAEPKFIHRCSIYLISGILALGFCFLFFTEVPVWVSTKGKILSDETIAPLKSSKKDMPNTSLIVKTAVPNQNIGFFKTGMLARIKVVAYPSEQFGVVPAQVLQILPNDGKSDDFIVILELLQNSINTSEERIQLFPGLAVQAEVQTSKQPLFKLLFSQ